MATVTGGLLSLGIALVGLVLGIALLIAVCRIALHHPGGYRHLLGVGVAILVVALWESGELGTVVREAASYLTVATRTASPPPLVPPPGQR